MATAVFFRYVLRRSLDFVHVKDVVAISVVFAPDQDLDLSLHQ